MLLMAPVILPIAGIHAINQAEVRANGYAPASKPRPRSYHRWSDQKKIESTGMSRSRGYSGPHIVHSGNPRRKVLEGTYKDGKWEGLWTGWHDNGQKQFEGTYKKGKKVSAKYWNSKGEEVETLDESQGLNLTNRLLPTPPKKQGQ
jgi:hypothetical protein